MLGRMAGPMSTVSCPEMALGALGKRSCNAGSIWVSLGLLRNRVSLLAQLVKNLLAMQETPVRFLGQEDPLEKE